MTSIKYKNVLRGASEIVQWVMRIATKPKDLSSSPRTHMVERENQLPLVVLLMSVYT